MSKYKKFIEDFLRINPTPSKKQAQYLMFSLGISDFECPDFVESVIKARTRVQALTESERVLINDYDPALVNTDKLLINDGDNATSDGMLGDQDALAYDGFIEENPTIEDFESHNNTNNGANSQ